MPKQNDHDDIDNHDDHADHDDHNEEDMSNNFCDDHDNKYEFDEDDVDDKAGKPADLAHDVKLLSPGRLGWLAP